MAIMRDPPFVSAVSVYDAFGRVIHQSPPYFVGNTVHAQTFSYDLAGRLKTISRPVDSGNAHLCVFVPNAPNPTQGRMLFARTEECKFLNMTTEDEEIRR